MTRPWPEIRLHYSEAPLASWRDGMLTLIDHITRSGLDAGLHAWTSMFDLCIVQTPVTYPYMGPLLRISPVPGTDQIEFRYIDTMISSAQWHRIVDCDAVVDRFNRFVEQLCWST